MRALLLIDLQNDFMPNGALPVPNGDKIIPIINALIPCFSQVIATQDWHPKNHESFAANHPGKKPGDRIDLYGVAQVLWPSHCVQNTEGAALVSALEKTGIKKIIQKGCDPKVDSYSAFFDNAQRHSTGLDDYLKEKKVHALFIAGVATDYCVLFSVLDALRLGYDVFVVKDACLGIDLHKGDIEKAFKQMEEKGAHILSSGEILEMYG